MEEHTSLILDLRDRMTRIETKLDGHNEAHSLIDRRLDKLEADSATQRQLLSAFQVRAATVASIFAGFVAILGAVGDHVWSLLF